MQIHQILIRPETNTTIILYVDLTGRRDSIVLDTTNDAAIQKLIQFCQAKLPADADNPAKPKIQKEIAELEGRLTKLKQAIGAA
jgi:hypothetical protein